MQQPVFHSTHSPWLSSQVRCTGLRTVERVIEFSIFDLGHQKGRWANVHLDLPSYKISAQSRKRCSRYALPKFFSLGRWFLTPQGHPRSNLTVPNKKTPNRKPVGPMYKCSGVHRFRDILSRNCDCWPFDLCRANPWAKGHQKGRWPTAT